MEICDEAFYTTTDLFVPSSQPFDGQPMALCSVSAGCSQTSEASSDCESRVRGFGILAGYLMPKPANAGRYRDELRSLTMAVPKTGDMQC